VAGLQGGGAVAGMAEETSGFIERIGALGRSARVSTGPVSAVRDAAGPPSGGAPPASRPLATLLSQALVAFTIEFDNEFEYQMRHRTTRGPAAHSRHGPWLVSMAMWSNFMQFLAEEGAPLRELEGLARMTNLAGLERWGYIVVEPDPADHRPKPPRRDLVVQPTRAGRRAQEVWRPLAGVIEQRWQERFGTDEISRLRAALQALASQFGAGLPRYLPVAGLPKQNEERWVSAGPGAGAASPLDLPALMSQVLLAFTVDFERESDLSLALSANALRVLTEPGVRVRDLPRLAGVSREAISLSLGFLGRCRFVVVEADPPASQAKLARLTPPGRRAQESYRRLLGVIEERWEARFGGELIRGLRESLHGLFEQAEGEQPRLSQGLRPYPGGWRAHQPYLTQTMDVLHDPGGALPHYPMVSHRGGFPDGS
jgi:DNA-binding MarR family transcriptional regulator